MKSDQRRYGRGMSGGIDFTLAGIPVRVLWMFFIVAFLLGSGSQDPLLIALWMGVLFVSILLHELGHAFACRAFGVQPAVVLHGFGGLTFGRSLPVKQDLLVSLAGPAAGLSIGLPLWWVQANVAITSPLVADLVSIAVWINVLWGVVNLLPLMPLDGGHATNALLSLIFRRDMTRPTRVISIVTAGIGVALALRYGLLFGALLAGWYLVMNVQELRKTGPGTWSPTVTMPTPPPTPTPTPTGASDAPKDAAVPSADAPRPPERPTRPGQRTFALEVDAAARALARDEPELAAIAIDRARRLARTDEDESVVAPLEAELRRRLAE